jgi:hypothetical protein
MSPTRPQQYIPSTTCPGRLSSCGPYLILCLMWMPARGFSCNLPAPTGTKYSSLPVGTSPPFPLHQSHSPFALGLCRHRRATIWRGTIPTESTPTSRRPWPSPRTFRRSGHVERRVSPDSVNGAANTPAHVRHGLPDRTLCIGNQVARPESTELAVYKVRQWSLRVGEHSKTRMHLWVNLRDQLEHHHRL